MSEAVPEPGSTHGASAQGGGSPHSVPVLSGPAGVHALLLVDELIFLPFCFRRNTGAPSWISVARLVYLGVPLPCVVLPTAKLVWPYMYYVHCFSSMQVFV